MCYIFIVKISDAIITHLRDSGVKYVFGVSGANIEHIHDAIFRLGDNKLKSIMAKHESGAAFMADGHARVHRTLGVCCATSGGGMLNLLTGIAESYMESVPVLALVGQAPTSLEGAGAFQDSSGLNHSVQGEQLWASVTKYMAKIDRAEHFWERFLGAIEAAQSGRPGPAVLLIPRDVYDLEVGPCPLPLPISPRQNLPLPPGEGLINALSQAKSPVLIIGQGVERSKKYEKIIQFALETKIPTATTMSSLGLYPNDAANYLGMVGMAGHPSTHRYIMEESDFVLVAGTGLSILNRGPLGPTLNDPKAYFINLETESIHKAFPKANIIQSEVGTFFEEFSQKIGNRVWSFPSNYKRQVYKPILSDLSQTNMDGLLQSEAIKILQEVLPNHGHLVFDAGNCAAAAMHYSKVPWQTSTTIALGMGGMGYSVGAAIGAQLGSPQESRTVVFLGDGAFLMTGLEIHTAVEFGLPILFIVFNNSQHGMCTTREKLYFEGRLECVSYHEVDVATVARGLGRPDQLWTGVAETKEQLKESIRDYLNHIHLPGVLELKIRREEIPPFTAFLPKEAKIIDL